MASGVRWLLAMLICILVVASPALADEAPSTTPKPPQSVTDDSARLLELGKLLMGQNNPEYAAQPTKLEMAERNAAGEQALGIFRRLVKMNDKVAEHWLWLGIALTETLTYSKKKPTGAPVTNEKVLAEGIQAFKAAFDRNPRELVIATYYGTALLERRRDFDGTLAVWQKFLEQKPPEMERAMALVQAGRACLNKAFYGKIEKRPAADIKQAYLQAADYVAQAAKICPNSADVRQMQKLLTEHKKDLGGG
ncbi:MAG: tetratricopeptide repeat protein [Armatimonadota bacterium]